MLTVSPKIEKTVLISSVFIAGLCSIIYELLISTASSYFMGDSVTQFSITIGIYMAAMGFGAFVSRKFQHNLLAIFIVVEILLGLIGGLSIPLLYFFFAYTDLYYQVMITLIFTIGSLTGLEVPLITRILEKHYELDENLSNVLSLDYLGALIATLLFPFILLPFAGIFKSSLLFGLINMGIGFLVLMFLSEKIGLSKRKVYFTWSITVSVFLLLMLTFSQILLKNWESGLYEDRIVYTKQSKYQKLVLTKSKNDLRLYLNGNLQFSSMDEKRYHEPLVHIPFSFLQTCEKVLILGGGDGFAIREVLKYKDIQSVTLVDLDPAVTELARNNPHIASLTGKSLDNSKVKIIHEDAFQFLLKQSTLFDLIIIDLPDPNNNSLARLYSKEFYKLIDKNLSRQGLFVTQATSPYFCGEAFWCINKTIKSAGFKTYPYHAYVPSFGDWGFVMASRYTLKPESLTIKPVDTDYLNNEVARSAFSMAKDIQKNNIEASSLNKPAILDYYLNGWKQWN